MNKRGFSLPEILISGGLFLLLSLLLFQGASQGLMAWQTVSQRNEVLTEAQKFVRLLERELESASLASLECQNHPVACLAYASPFEMDNRREFETAPSNGALRWSRQVVISHDPAKNRVVRREFPLTPTQAAFVTATPISATDVGLGLKPLGFYAGPGQPIARRVRGLEFALEGYNLDLLLTLLTKDEKELHISSRTRIRNR